MIMLDGGDDYNENDNKNDDKLYIFITRCLNVLTDDAFALPMKSMGNDSHYKLAFRTLRLTLFLFCYP